MMAAEKEVLANVKGLTARRLRRWIREGWVDVEIRGGRREFRDIDIARVRLVHQLRDELRVNREAVPIILSLIDQVYGLRRELRHLARAVEDQPRSVRRKVSVEFRRRRQS